MNDLLPSDSEHLFNVKDQVKLCCSGISDVGRRRESNQDQYLIADLHKHMLIESSSIVLPDSMVFGRAMGKLLLVADGMGGAQAGDIASRMAIESTSRFLVHSMHWLLHPSQPEIKKFVEDLKAAAHCTHESVRNDAANHPHHQGMGTTLTLAYIIWPMMIVLHIGDSRCYVLHRGQLQQITKDQTLAQFLYDQGQISSDDFAKSPYHHVLWSAIGSEDAPEAVVYRQRLDIGDRILLCSDGVTRHWNHDELHQLLESEHQAESICTRLVETANQRGGEDNITAIAVSCESP